MLNAKIKTETVLSHCLTPQDWCVRIGSVMPFRVVLNLLQIAVYLKKNKAIYCCKPPGSVIPT